MPSTFTFLISGTSDGLFSPQKHPLTLNTQLSQKHISEPVETRTESRIEILPNDNQNEENPSMNLNIYSVKKLCIIVNSISSVSSYSSVLTQSSNISSAKLKSVILTNDCNRSSSNSTRSQEGLHDSIG